MRVLKDIRQELGWILFYGAVLFIVCIAAVQLLITSRYILNDLEYAVRFEKDHCVFVKTYDEEPYGLEEINTLYSSGISEVLSQSESAGTWLTSGFNGRSGIDQVVIVVGSYINFCDIQMGDQAVKYAVSDNLRYLVGKQVFCNSKTITVDESISSEFTIYHPLMSYTDRGNTMYAFAYDYSDVSDLIGFEVLGTNALFHLMLVNPSEEEKIKTARILNEKGKYAEFITQDEYREQQSQATTREYMNSLLFYFGTIIVFVIACLKTMMDCLKKRINEYVVYRVFGSYREAINIRAGLLAEAYLLLPTLGILLLLWWSEWLSAVTAGICILINLAIVAGAVMIIDRACCLKLREGAYFDE